MAESPPLFFWKQTTQELFFPSLFNCFWWFSCLINRPFYCWFKTAISLHWWRSAMKLGWTLSHLRGCTPARRLIQAAALLDRLWLLPAVGNPLGSGLCSGERRSTSSPSCTHTKTPCNAVAVSSGGKINSFLFSPPLCQMTQIICAAVTQCLAETKLHRPWIYLFFLLFCFVCNMDSRSPDNQSLMRIDHIT